MPALGTIGAPTHRGTYGGRAPFHEARKVPVIRGCPPPKFEIGFSHSCRGQTMVDRGKSFIGAWRITHMDEWDQDYIDLEMNGYIRFNDDKTGNFQFGTVQGFIDYRIQKYGKQARIEFSWEGCNDTDPGCGRGWAIIEKGQLTGHLFIHMCDDSAFIAKKQE
jgi:hypothetical protein